MLSLLLLACSAGHVTLDGHTGRRAVDQADDTGTDTADTDTDTGPLVDTAEAGLPECGGREGVGLYEYETRVGAPSVQTVTGCGGEFELSCGTLTDPETGMNTDEPPPAFTASRMELELGESMELELGADSEHVGWFTSCGMTIRGLAEGERWSWYSETFEVRIGGWPDGGGG